MSVAGHRTICSPDKGIDLNGLHVVQLLQGRLNLPLVRLHIHHKHQRVILLDLLHRTLRVEGMDNDLVLIEAWLMRYGLAWVLGCAGEFERLGTVEGGAGAHFADFLRIDLFNKTGRQQCPEKG